MSVDRQGHEATWATPQTLDLASQLTRFNRIATKHEGIHFAHQPVRWLLVTSANILGTQSLIAGMHRPGQHKATGAKAAFARRSKRRYSRQLLGGYYSELPPHH